MVKEKAQDVGPQLGMGLRMVVSALFGKEISDQIVSRSIQKSSVEMKPGETVLDEPLTAEMRYVYHFNIRFVEVVSEHLPAMKMAHADVAKEVAEKFLGKMFWWTVYIVYPHLAGMSLGVRWEKGGKLVLVKRPDEEEMSPSEKLGALFGMLKSLTPDKPEGGSSLQ